MRKSYNHANKVSLTGREKQILRLLQKDRSNQELAAELKIQPKTIANHLSRIYRRIGT